MSRASTKTQPPRHSTLRAALKDKGWSQRRLAHLLGKGEPYVSRLIAGQFQPSLAVADRIQTLLNVELSAMIPASLSGKD